MKHLSWRRYKIQFAGSVQLDRPLQPEQAAYLKRFLSTRRISWASEYTIQQAIWQRNERLIDENYEEPDSLNASVRSTINNAGIDQIEATYLR